MIRVIYRMLILCAALMAACNVYARNIAVINHSPYLIEVSGAVNASVSENPIKPNGRTILHARKNSLLHLMFIKTGAQRYYDNMLVSSTNGKFTVISLYKKTHFLLSGQQITVLADTSSK